MIGKRNKRQGLSAGNVGEWSVQRGNDRLGPRLVQYLSVSHIFYLRGEKQYAVPTLPQIPWRLMIGDYRIHTLAPRADPNGMKNMKNLLLYDGRVLHLSSSLA
jgi:hypothetical protein